MADDKERWWQKNLVYLVGSLTTLAAVYLGQRMSSGSAERVKRVELRYSAAAKGYMDVLQSVERYGEKEMDLSIAQTNPIPDFFPDKKAKDAAVEKASRGMFDAYDEVEAAMQELWPYLNPEWRDWLSSKVYEFEGLSEYPYVDLIGNTVTPTPTTKGTAKRDRNVVKVELEQGLLAVLFDSQNTEDYPPTPVAGSVPTPRKPEVLQLLPTPDPRTPRRPLK